MAFAMSRQIFTIGHSNHTWDKLVTLLKQHGVQVLVDTRSNPVSRFAPYASSRRLPGLLEQEGIRYVYLGDGLGGRPNDRSCYDEKGRPDYRVMRSRESFREGVEELLGLAEESAVAIMCAEEDPAKCHRTLLVGPALEQRGVRLRHIRKDGMVEDMRLPIQLPIFGSDPNLRHDFLTSLL